SWRAWAMILSASAREIVSMIGRLSSQRPYQGLLDRAKPAVDLERGDLGVLGVERGELVLELLGDLQPYAERQAHVVQRAHPVAGLVTGQPHLAAVLRQRVQQGLGEVLLGLPQGRLRVPAVLTSHVR